LPVAKKPNQIGIGVNHPAASNTATGGGDRRDFRGWSQPNLLGKNVLGKEFSTKLAAAFGKGLLMETTADFKNRHSRPSISRPQTSQICGIGIN
jgi:hypothetical protein